MSEPEHTHNGDQQQLREEFPTGWIALTKNESVAYLVDALLDLPPHREFNQSEIAKSAGVSRQSVHRHRDLLLQTGIIEEVEDTAPQRYRFNEKSPVSEALIQLDGALNEAGPEAHTTAE